MLLDIVSGYERLMVIVLITILVSCFFVYHCWQIYISPWSHIPGIASPIPIIGNLLSLTSRNDNLKNLDGYHKRLGDTYIIWVLFKPVVITCNPDLFDSVLKSSDEDFLEKGSGYDTFRDWIQDGIVCSTGKKWQKRRKQLTTCFHFNMLKSYLPIINYHSQAFINILKKESGNIIQDIAKLTKVMSLGIICESATGMKLTSKENEAKLHQYLESLEVVSYLTAERRRRPLYYSNIMLKILPIGSKYRKAVKMVHAFTRELITEAITHYNESNPKSNFLDNLSSLHQNGEIDAEGLMEETNTFIFAGHDTVSASLAWLLYNLGTNTVAQDKAFCEADMINKMEVCMEEKIKQMKYLECTIKESLRLRSTLPFIARYMKKDFSFPNGMSIPRGTEFVLNLRGMHHNSSIWENPEKFIPERFDGNSAFKRPVFSFVPFSAGPRNCIGQRFAMMELKVSLFHILLNFKIEAVDKESDIVEVLDVVLNSAGGIKLKLTERT